MSADVNDLIYAVWKALHAGGEYAKVRAAARHRLQPATRHPTPCARIEWTNPAALRSGCPPPP
jgi:hypothetical protein